MRKILKILSTFEKLCYLCCMQSGFKTTFSLTETIKASLDKKRFGCGIFIDLQKAFDTVNHDILLKKLEHYGIRGTALNWFKSYLSNRKQFVSINGHSSSLANISCGVPQGSVLGPLLFLIYINDLPDSSHFLSFFLFADDTNIYCESDNLELLTKKVNRELKKVKLWLDSNKLALNIEKTNWVLFHSPWKKLTVHNNLKIGKQYIQRTKFVKFLGVLMDEHLTWKYHTTKLCKKLSKTAGIFFKVRHYVPLPTLISLYNSLFLPFLNYGISAWGMTYESYLDPLFKLQKKILRCIKFKPFSASSTPIF